jgi:hypothetical protein
VGFGRADLIGRGFIVTGPKAQSLRDFDIVPGRPKGTPLQNLRRHL